MASTINTGKRKTFNARNHGIGAYVTTHMHKIEFEAIDYLQLVDWAGRAIREGKRGYIPANVPPILARLNIEPQAYLKQLHSTKNRLSLPVALGSAKALREFANRHGRKFLRNVKTFQACT